MIKDKSLKTTTIRLSTDMRMRIKVIAALSGIPIYEIIMAALDKHITEMEKELRTKSKV